MEFRDWTAADWHAYLRPKWLQMEAIKNETCHHPNKRLTRRVCADGQVRYMAQCPKCGKTSRTSLKKKDGDAINPPPPAYHDGLYEQTLASRHARLKPSAEAFYSAYDEYLRSTVWMVKRQICLETRFGRCAHCDAEAQQAHHLTYERVGNEHPDDLLPLCATCHQRAHATTESEIFPEVFL